MGRTARLRFVVVVASFGIVVAGCKMIEKRNARDTEQLLSATGFKMKLANTPEKRAHLETLTQRKLVPHERDDETYYVYSDDLECNCLYVGNEKAYQEYQKLKVKQEIADEQALAASMNEGAAMNWGLWGPPMGGFYRY